MQQISLQIQRAILQSSRSKFKYIMQTLNLVNVYSAPK